MSRDQLDDVDRELITLIQENPRYPATELAERIGVSDNTIHNRIRRLEEDDIIAEYSTVLNLDRLGFGLYYMFTCTVRISERAEVAERVRAIPAVLEVTELMTGQQNLLVKAVATEDRGITQVAERIEEFDLEIEDEDLIRAEHTNRSVDIAAIEALFQNEE